MKQIVSIILSLITIMTIILGVNTYRSLPTAPAHSNKSSTSSVESNLEDENSVKFNKVDIDYFNDALFIGDSRTVGLGKYSLLQSQTEADFFAQTGLSAISVFNIKNSDMQENVTLSEKLQSRIYGKIYIMFGVNEITNDLDENLKVFGNLIESIKSYQPDALIFIQANLHVGKGRSESYELYSNARLDEYNEMLSSLADNKTIYYIDFNAIYDDDEGNLSEEFTCDDLHLNSNCHDPWIEYLKSHAIIQ